MSNAVVSHEFKLQLKFPGEEDYSQVIGLDNITTNFTGGTQSHSAYEDEGWVTNIATEKGMTITCGGWLTYGDAVHDKLIQLMFADAANSNNIEFEIIFPLSSNAGSTTPAKFGAKGVINFNGDELTGASNDVSPINFEILISGKPTYTPET